MKVSRDIRRIEQGLNSAEASSEDKRQFLKAQREYIPTGLAAHKKILNMIANTREGRLLRQAAHRVPGVADYDAGFRFETLMGRVDRETKGLILCSTDVLEDGTGEVLGTLEFAVFNAYLGSKLTEGGGKMSYQERTPRDVMVFFVPDPKKVPQGMSSAPSEFTADNLGLGVRGGIRSIPLTFAAKGEASVLSEVQEKLSELLSLVAGKVETAASQPGAPRELVQLRALFDREEDGRNQKDLAA